MSAAIHLIYPRARGAADAIAAHTTRLADALDRLPDITGTHGPPSTMARHGGDILVQYNPFSYGRWGFAPGIVLRMAGFRVRHRAQRLTTFVHEPYVAPTSARTVVMGAWQRLQLLAVRALSDAVMVPSRDAAQRCGQRFRPPSVVPVGSNLPERRASRGASRRTLGVTDDDVVLAVFGRSGAGRRLDHVGAAIRATSGTGISVTLLALGCGHEVPSRLPPDVHVYQPGLLPPEDVASLLAASDVFLAPYDDGLSTRRGALMAALQHGVPVVGTTAGRTDDLLASTDAIVLTPLEDVTAFAQAAARLAGRSEERARRGAAARQLHDEHFAWSVISRGVAAQALGDRWTGGR